MDIILQTHLFRGVTHAAFNAEVIPSELSRAPGMGHSHEMSFKISKLKLEQACYKTDLHEQLPDLPCFKSDVWPKDEDGCFRTGSSDIGENYGLSSARNDNVKRVLCARE